MPRDPEIQQTAEEEERDQLERAGPADGETSGRDRGLGCVRGAATREDWEQSTPSEGYPHLVLTGFDREVRLASAERHPGARRLTAAEASRVRQLSPHTNWSRLESNLFVFRSSPVPHICVWSYAEAEWVPHGLACEVYAYIAQVLTGMEVTDAA